MSRNFKQLVIILIMLWATSSSWAQGLYIGGHKAVRDILYSQWLCSIPKEYFGTDWTVQLDFDSTCTRATFNGVSIRNGAVVTFDSIAPGKGYSFSVVYKGRTHKGKIQFTWLPVMELNGTFGNDYAEGTVSISESDGTSNDEMSAKLKWRGGLTNLPGKQKRNYSIKFLDENGDKMDRKLLDMRKDNHWKLDAGQVDLLRVRNRVCTDLWLDMAVKPWYAELEPKAINGSRGKAVEVILNERYHGIYHLIEPVDRKQLKLVKHDTINNEFHGQLWYNKAWCRTGTMSSPVAYDNNSPKWDSIYVEYPDFEEVNPTDWSTLANAVNFAYNTNRTHDIKTFEDSLGYYFDLPVFIDYFIFIAALQIRDNESKNIMYSAYDKTLDPRVMLTPWDLDVSVGAKLYATWTEDKYMPESDLSWISNVPMFNMYHNSKSLQRKIRKRYWELRRTYFVTDSLVERFQRVVDELEACGAAGREERRWSQNADIGGRVLDLSGEMEYVEDWIRRRMAYVDEFIFPPVEILPGDVNDDGEVNISDISEIIDLMLGEPVTDEDLKARADVNGDGEVNISDISDLIDLLLH